MAERYNRRRNPKDGALRAVDTPIPGLMGARIPGTHAADFTLRLAFLLYQRRKTSQLLFQAVCEVRDDLVSVWQKSQKSRRN